MATAPKAKHKGVQPGGTNVRVPKAKPRPPTRAHPSVNPGGIAIFPPGKAPPKPPAPKKAKKKTVAKKKAVKRGLALGEAVPCCVAESLAASLRLTGWRVNDTDVLALHQLAARDGGAYIEDVLEAASTYGLAGIRLARHEPVTPADAADAPAGLILGIDQPGPHTVLDDGSSWWSWGQPWEPFAGAVISEAWAVTWGSA